MTTALFESSIPSLTQIARGKVRDIYAVDADHLLIVTSDRLSAFVAEFLPAAKVRVLGPVHDDVPAESLAAIKSSATADRVWLLEASG